MRFEPYPNFTVTKPRAGAPAEAWESYYAENQRFIIRCDNEYRCGQLAIKLDEYCRRAQISPNKKTVRNAICKMAIIDSLMQTPDSSADYFDTFDYAKSGLEAYGADLLIESHEEAEEFFLEFDSAFKTIQSYVDSGNEWVTGGTQLPEAL